MTYFYHKFKVSSGKDMKTITKVYEDEKVARENHLLLGGELKVLKEV